MKKFLVTLLLSSGMFAGSAYSALIDFSGDLVFIETDEGGAVYSDVPLGTTFSGSIDDVTANGFITDGATRIDFTCCIAAGGRGPFSNDTLLDADDAALLNMLAGKPIFSDGDLVDGVDIEGDTTTAGGGRIEVGLSYILDPDTFISTDPPNSPFDANDVLLELFFIVEENSADAEIYNSIGRISVVPLPASLWLFGSALALLGWSKRRET